MPTVSSDLRPRDEHPVTLATSHPADQATIDAAHAAYLRALRERDAAAAELSHVLEHTGGAGLERADERRTDAAHDLADAGEALLSALGYGLPAEPAADRGAPGHDGHDAETARAVAELRAAGSPPERTRPECRTVWNEHTNDIGDHCPHSGEETDEDPDDPEHSACPAGCRASYPTTDED